MASSLFPQQQNQKQQQINKGLEEIKALVKDKDPRAVFYQECEKRGVDPESILPIVRMFMKK